jgi:hypothetical protein
MVMQRSKKTAAPKGAAATPRSRELTEDGEVVINRTQEHVYSIVGGATGKTVVISASGRITVSPGGPQTAPPPHRQELTEEGDVVLHRSQSHTYVVTQAARASGHGAATAPSGQRITVSPDGGISIGTK